MQAADQGWDKGQTGGMGLAQVPLAGVQGARRVQAWLYDSLNKGLLAGRIQALMLMNDLLEDWYFSWALLRTEGALQDVLMELVKVCLRGRALPWARMLWLYRFRYQPMHKRDLGSAYCCFATSHCREVAGGNM
jgi:hypothetical protein